MDRRRCLRAVGLAAVVACPGWVRAAPLRGVAVQMQVEAPLKGLPVRLAERLGYFAAEGLPVVLETADARSAEFPMGTTAARVYAGGFERIVQRTLQGHPEKAFLSLARTPQIGFGVRPAAQGDAIPPALLQESRIGVPAIPSLAHRVAWLVLQAHDVRPKPSHFVELPDARLAQEAFVRGQVDAICYGDPLLTRLQRHGQIRLVKDTRSLSDSLRLFGGPVVCAVLSAPLPVLESHAPELQALSRAVVRALRWLQTASAMDLAAHADLAGFGSERATFLSMVAHTRGSFTADGIVDERSVQNVLRMLRTLPQGGAYDGLEPVRLYTERFSASA